MNLFSSIIPLLWTRNNSQFLRNNTTKSKFSWFYADYVILTGFGLLNHMQAPKEIAFSAKPFHATESLRPTKAVGRYEVRLAENAAEITSALRLRHDVFNVELGGKAALPFETKLEFDAYDFKCRHLIVICRETQRTVGTYRLNTIETAGSTDGFYSATEFTIGDLPADVLNQGIEIGRACIAKEHRNTKVLFLLWKELIDHLDRTGKRYFFGCCSIFTQDVAIGRRAFDQLKSGGYMDSQLRVKPIRNELISDDLTAIGDQVELPNLFKMYLRLGARVCSSPMLDTEFGTIDFFVVFDSKRMNRKYHRMFAGR